MQKPSKLTYEEIQELRTFLSSVPRNKDSVKVVGGQEFTFADHCEMAYMMWQRLGKNMHECHRAWCAMMQSNPTVCDVMALVAYHVEQSI